MMRRFAVPSLAAGLVLSTVAIPAAGHTPDGEAEPRALAAVSDTDDGGIECPLGPVPDSGFTDVAGDAEHKDAIDLGVELGLIEGTSATTFEPARDVSRGQLASLIARSLDASGVDLPSVDGSPTFSDVGSTHGDNIRRLAAADIVRGQTDGSFGTNDPVKRDQMASLLVRAAGYVTDEEITPAERGYFDDMTDGVHAQNVDAAFELGLLEGMGDDTFAPRADTRRDQSATVIVRFVVFVELLLSDGSTEVTLLHDTHFHGKYVENDDLDIGRYFALVQERKDCLGDQALFMGNGDDVAPSVFSGLFEPNGIHMVEALNEAPIDINTLGNHEFDFGPDNARDLIEAADFPFVTANLRDIDSGEVFGADVGVEEFVTFEVGPVSVGVTGLAPEGTASVTTLGDDTEQIPAEEGLDLVVPKMRDAGVDVVVVTSHLCGNDALDLADTYDGADVIAGDHCAGALEEPYVSDNGTIVSFAGDEFQFLGELTLTVLDGEVVDHRFLLHDVEALAADLEPVAGVQEVVDDYSSQLDEELNVVIGERTVDWDTRTPGIRQSENAAGNFFTDEMRSGFEGSDIAVTNSGGIRGNTVYEAGDITRRDIAEIFPFGNRLVQAEIDGETLLEALEFSVARLPDADGRFLQVSGMEVTFDSSQPEGERVLTVVIGDEALDEGDTYTMATNDFTLAGGDGYEMFEDLEVIIDGNAGPVLDSYLIERIEQREGTIDTDVEGRLTDVADEG